MKRPRTIAREITQTQARIAARREKQARIGQEIAELLAAQKAQLIALMTDAIDGVDVSRLPLDELLSAIANLGKRDAEEKGDPSVQPVAVATVETVVKISRNASRHNRAILTSNRLHWNGKKAAWTGSVTEEELAGLRLVFGDRVVPAETAGAGPEGQDPGRPLPAAPGAVSEAVEPSAAPAGDVQDQVGTTVPDASMSAVATLRSPFRGLPPRRPAS